MAKISYTNLRGKVVAMPGTASPLMSQRWRVLDTSIKAPGMMVYLQNLHTEAVDVVHVDTLRGWIYKGVLLVDWDGWTDGLRGEGNYAAIPAGGVKKLAVDNPGAAGVIFPGRADGPGLNRGAEMAVVAEPNKSRTDAGRQPNGIVPTRVAESVVAVSASSGFDKWMAQGLKLPARCPYHGDVICHLCLARGLSW